MYHYNIITTSTFVQYPHSFAIFHFFCEASIKKKLFENIQIFSGPVNYKVYSLI